MKEIRYKIVHIRSYLALIVFCCFQMTISLHGQVKDVGIPFIKNFSREDYKAGTQNWSITQDNNGFMYFANNMGVLRFDGSNWDIFSLPNNSIVRVVAFIDNKIYAGGFDEFGYYKYNHNGEFIYTSLSAQLDEASKDIGEIWRIYSTRYGIVFQSYRKIFLLKSGELHQLSPQTQFGFSYVVDSNFFVVDRGNGLYILQGKSIKPIIKNSQFFNENEVSFIFSHGDNSYLIGTTTNGIFLYDGRELMPWNSALNKRFIDYQIYTALEIGSEHLAIGTIQNGLFIVNRNGNILQHINRFRGLQNNTVLSLFYDQNQNIWLGLDNGIDMLEISSPLSILNYCYNIETSYTSIVHKDILYIGTNQGLFAREFSQIGNEKLLYEGFRLIDGTQGQVWSLELIDDHLICGHNFGTFLIEGFKAHKISDVSGGWDYIKVPGFDNYMIGGTYDGLMLYAKISGLKPYWKPVGFISGFSESARELAFDDEGNLWVTHGYKGLYKIKLSSQLNLVEKISHYNHTNGLPDLPYAVSQIKGKSVIVAGNNIYKYSAKNNLFVVDDELNRLFGNKPGLSKVFEDNNGDVWFFTNTHFGVHRLQEDGTYVEITIPFRRINNQFLANPYENVFAYDQSNVFIGGQKGMLHYNPQKQKPFNVDYTVLLRDIIVSKGQTDSILLKLYGPDNAPLDKQKLKIPYKYNSIAFQFVTPFFEANSETQYTYRLKGFDNQWSEWTGRNMKEYTNLYEGEYVFEIKARNIYNTESTVTSFHFTITPPFFRSLVAYIFYGLLFLVSIGISIYLVQKHMEKTRRKEKLKHERVLIAKENQFKEESKISEDQIQALKNEKLVNEMRYKNMELANATMHLIHKNKFLIKLKTDLSRMWGEAKVESVKSDIKQIIKKIDKDFKSEQHWKVFDKYFDEVHQDFINRLKVKHPTLTPNDLRLCAYLKMNLSTKEIAPLMNISVRGLEISRYRLRKKLDIDRETNLIDHIISI